MPNAVATQDTSSLEALRRPQCGDSRRGSEWDPWREGLGTISVYLFRLYPCPFRYVQYLRECSRLSTSMVNVKPRGFAPGEIPAKTAVENVGFDKGASADQRLVAS